MASERFRPHSYPGETEASEKQSFPKEEILPESMTGSEAIATISEIKEMMADIDMNLLQELIGTEYGKAGLEPEKLALIPRPNITVVYEPTSTITGRYNPFRKVIEINAAAISTHKNRFSALVHSLIHEQLHHISTVINREDVGTQHSIKTGIETAAFMEYSENEVIVGADYHSFLNEGLTEVITLRIVGEYLHINGITDEDREDFVYYKNNITGVRLLAAFYAILSDIPEATVEDAFTRTYLRNGAIIPDELAEHLSAGDKAALEVTIRQYEMDTTPEIMVDELVNKLPKEKLAIFNARCQELFHEYQQLG